MYGQTSRNRTGAHAPFSRFWPAGQNQCGVAWAPGAQATDGAAVVFGRGHTARRTECDGLGQRCWPSPVRIPFLLAA